jgi:hypothetical protein
MEVNMILSYKLAGLTKQLVHNNGEYRNLAKKRPKDFTRNRIMPFGELIIFMLMSHKNSTATALRRFFRDIGKETVTMTQQSLSEARKKVTVQAFTCLFRLTVDAMTEDCTKKWHNYRVYAIDGSKITLPADSSLRSHYGALGKDRTVPTAQASILYDVLNDIVCDAAIEPLSTDERTIAKKHIKAVDSLAANDSKLIIFDRGYPSFELIELLESKGLSYVMRVKSKFSKDIDSQASQDGYVWLEQNGKRIHVRVVKFALDSGETETLITNITDKRLGKNAFKKLYFLRWPVETKYDIVKNKLQLENFNTRTVEGIEQDFFAAMYLTNFAAATLIDVQSDIETARTGKNNKYRYKANMNELIGILKDRLVFAIAQDDPDMQVAMIDSILNEVRRNVVPIRPKRHVPRNNASRNSKFHHNQKANC